MKLILKFTYLILLSAFLLVIGSSQPTHAISLKKIGGSLSKATKVVTKPIGESRGHRW